VEPSGKVWKRKTEKTSRSLIRVGQGVALAVEKFVTVGQTIAVENLEISDDMCEACEEARMAGKGEPSLYD
jgi:hypothetical protein